jgi:hypothetical protein
MNGAPIFESGERPPRPGRTLPRLRALPLAGLILLVWFPAAAFISLSTSTTDPMSVSWDLDETILSLPNVAGGEVLYQVNSLGSDDISDGSDLAAVESAFRHWEGIPRSRIAFSRDVDTTLEVANDDGVNVVYWAEGSKTTILGNKNFRVEGFIGLTVIVNDTTGPSTGLLRNADIVLNGNELIWTTDPASADPNAYDAEEILTHEVGHIVGLDHSGVLGSTMGFRGAPGEVRRRTLDLDDMHGASSVYPDQDQGAATGSQNGITQNSVGAAVFGTLVATMDADGRVLSEGISQPSGNYSNPGMPPGSHATYVEPLDTAGFGATTLFEEADLSGIYAPGVFKDFKSSLDFPVSITPGGTTIRNFMVGTIAPTIHISAIGQRSTTTPAAVVFANSPTALLRGDTNVYIGVSGVNVNSSQIFEIPGTGVTVHGIAATGSANGEPAVVYDVSVDPNAALGLRSIRITFSGERTYATGAVEIMENTAYAGGIMGLPASAPGEVAPGLSPTGENRLSVYEEPGGIRLTWPPEPDSREYNLYRGDLSTLAGGGYNHAPLPGPNDSCGLVVGSTLLAGDLSDGQQSYYLVAGRNPLAVGPLGDGTGGPRPAGAPDCP